MGLVTVPQSADGDTATASDINGPINTIANEFNGNIDNANIKSAAAISGSKLASASIDSETKFSNVTGWTSVTDTWTYASYSSPVGTITVPSDATTKYSAGMKIKITQSTGGTKYGIITKVTSTVLTVYFGTDYTLNNETISSPFFSTHRSPFGFPLDPTKWTVTTTSTANCGKGTPTASTWYGDTGLSATGPNIALPIGSWKVSYAADLEGQKAATTAMQTFVSLSTSSSSESDTDFTYAAYIGGASGTIVVRTPVYKEKVITVTATTTYYLIIKTDQSSAASIAIRGDIGSTLLRAVCAYL